MLPLQPTSVSEVFQTKTIRLTVATNQDSTYLYLTFTLPDGSQKPVQVPTAATATLTRESIQARIVADPDLNAAFTTTDQSTNALDIAQRSADGDFTVSIRTPGSTLSVTQAVQQAAERSPRRYKVVVRNVLTAAAADSVLVNKSGRGSAGVYSVHSVSSSEPSITLDDIHDMLQPSFDSADNTVEMLLLTSSEPIELTTVPDSMLKAALAVVSGNAGINRISDGDYTVKTTDRLIVLPNAAAGRTLTFTSGSDGQRVLVMLEVASTGAWAVVGTENDPGDLNAAGENFEVVYLRTEDVWRVITDNVT